MLAMPESVFNKMIKSGNLSIIVEGVRIEDLLDDEFLGFIKEKFPDHGIRPSNLEITLLPPKGEEIGSEESSSKEDEGGEKEEKKTVIINISRSPPKIEFSHRGENDYQNKRMVLSADREEDIDKVSEDIGE